MAGKPEHPSSYSVPPNQDHRHSQEPQSQAVQHNSVLVYVSGDNLAYASAVGQNVVTSAGTVYQQQHQQQHHHQEQQHQQQGSYVTGLLPQVACDGYPTKTAAIQSAVTHGLSLVGTNCCRGQFLKNSDYVHSDGHELTTQQLECQQDRTLIWGNSSRYAGGGCAGLYNSCQQERPLIWGNAPRYSNGTAGGLDVNGITQEHGFPGKMISSVALGDGVNNMTAYPVQVSRLPESYVTHKRIPFTPDTTEHVVENCEQAYDGENNLRIAFLRQGIYTGDGEEHHHQGTNVKRNRIHEYEALQKQISFGSNCTSSVGRCDSVRSDTAESTCSSLSSSESQSQLQDAIAVATNSVYAQQAVHSVSQVHVHSFVPNNSNASAVTQRQQGHQQRQNYQPATSIPPGWKRICTNGVIIYISPSSTALGSLDQLKEYLTTAGTCKCGLECPLRPEQVFNFDPKVATRPWSPNQGKVREMTKLCNHKRKLIMPSTVACPVASATPIVSSSTAPAASVISNVPAIADSPTSTDKTKLDGFNKKKKRKLGSVGSLYSGAPVRFRSMGLDHSAPNSCDEFTEKSQSGNPIGSTVNISGPSFLEDPSGYLAQQTALLNSTISRQTGVSSSQVTILNHSKLPQSTPGMHLPNNVHLPQPKPSSITSPTSTRCYDMYDNSYCSRVYSSMKNNPTSPVVVHSSMTPTLGSNTSDSDSCQRCVTSADAQSSQDFYKQQNRQYMLHSDQSEDPVISSTFSEKFCNQQPDSRPIQGGTVSTSHGSPIGTNSPANLDTPTSSSATCISQPDTPQSLILLQPSTSRSYSQPPTPHSFSTSGHTSQSLTPQSLISHTLSLQGQQPSQSSICNTIGQEHRSATPIQMSNSNDNPPNIYQASNYPTISEISKKQISNNMRQTLEGYQPYPQTLTSGSRISLNSHSASSIITTMASGHTVSSNTITSVLAGRANTATVSVNTPSGILNPAVTNILPNRTAHQSQRSSPTNVPSASVASHHQNSIPIVHSQPPSLSVSKSPLEMVQSVVSSIQVPQVSGASVQHHQHQHHHQNQQQSNVQVHNVLSSGGILKHSPGSTLPPGHILVSSGGQLIMASNGSGIGGVMAPPPPKIISNASSMPPLSVSPMVTNVTGAVTQVIPAVGVAQQVIGQPTVLVNTTIQTPVLIQPGVMTMEGINQNVQIPHLAVATGNVIQNTQSILDANQDVTRNVNQNVANRQPALLSPESGMSKKKPYKKRKGNSQTVASMLQIASSQQNTGMLMQSQSNFAQQNFQTQSLGGPMLQALTIVPGKGGAPAQLVMNGQTGATSQFNTQQIITNPQPTQQINLLQPVNLLNSATGMVQNFPTIQQFIVPGLGSMVMSADGTATLLQDTGNIGMQLQIQSVNGQNVLTPVQSHGGIFSPSQSILAAGPAGMVIRSPQTTGGKIIQQHSPGAQFLSPNSGQFLVNGTTSFNNQLSPIVANMSPNQQVTFNTAQVRPQNIQGQQKFIQMNGQTLMVPCGTTQNIAVSSSPNQQNTTFVQQNTTIVQQQTTMVSNNQMPNFQSSASNNGANVEQSMNLDHNQSYILSAGIIQGKSPSPKSTVHSPSSDQGMDQQQQQYVLASSSTTVLEKSGQQGQLCPLMARHSVSTQTAGSQANIAQSAMMRQGSPPDTTTHSPGNSQRSNSPAVDTTTHGAASPAPPITTRHQSYSTPMVHCVSSSEPDSGDGAMMSDDWRIQDSMTKEIKLNQAGHHRKAYVESTVTTGIQIYTKQVEGVMSTMRCEGKDALGRGIKRKLDSIHSMHSTLHEDQDVPFKDEGETAKPWKLEVGEVVWGAARGSTAWPGKVESLGAPGSLTVWVRWYGGGGSGNNLSKVDVKTLKSLSDGLEAHHRARKKFRKSRKLNMQLENAIQEAMAELDKVSESRSILRPEEKVMVVNSNGQAAKGSKTSSLITMISTSKVEAKRTTKSTDNSSKFEKKQYR